jgi:hypothetical protein
MGRAQVEQPARRAVRIQDQTGAVGEPAPHCTFAVADALPFKVNVHVFSLFPPLEHAPDQIASRPFEMLSVIDVPAANDADPVLPTATLSPEGVELTVSPPRPVAVSVSVDVPVAVDELDGLTSSVADCVTPPPDTDIVTGVSTETDDVKMLKPPRVVPAGTIIPFGTDATAGLLLAT